MPIEQARALAAALGMALDQDSVALVDPRAAYSNGLIRINLSVKADKYAAEILAAIQAVAPEIDGFTALGNNFDVLNFTDMTTEELAGKVNQAIDGLDFDATVTFGDTQSELVEKTNCGEHIEGLRPDAGQEIRGRVEWARDQAREIVAREIRSASDLRVQPGTRKGTGRAAAARLDDGIKRSPFRDEEFDNGSTGPNDSPAAREAVRRPAVNGTPEDCLVDLAAHFKASQTT